MPSTALSRRRSTATRACVRAGRGKRATGSRRLLRCHLDRRCRNSSSCQADASTDQRELQPPYGRNQQYSITAVTGTTGTVQERYAYTAYGEPTILDSAGTTVLASSANGNQLMYTGREWDAELALYHYRARMYDPVAGRFVSRDPIGYVDGPSLYRAFFAPQGVDPSGKKTAIRPQQSPASGCGNGSAGTGANGRTVSLNPGPTAPTPATIPFGPQFPIHDDWHQVPIPTWPADLWPGMPDDLEPGLYPAPGSPGYPEAVKRARKRKRGKREPYRPLIEEMPFISTDVQPLPVNPRSCREAGLATCTPDLLSGDPRKACAESNGPGYTPENGTVFDEDDNYPIETDGLYGEVKHYSCQNGPPPGGTSILCGLCCVDLPGGGIDHQKRCKEGPIR